MTKKSACNGSASCIDATKSRNGSKPTTVRLDLGQIKCYERNPRQGLNPEYDRIKASILAAGLDQPLRVTQRPGEDQYLVQAGGNTRLRILRELFDATGDACFGRVDCLWVDWDRESSVLLAHLRENDLRGNLTFIDKAQAIAELGQLIAAELGKPCLSSRELEAELKLRGYSVSRSLIAQMEYAVAVLLPRMPIALRSGLGRPQIQRIRNLQRVGGEIWVGRQLGSVAEFDAVFAELCRRHDGIDWQYEPLLQAVEVELAEAAEIGIQVTRLEVACRLAGRPLEIPAFVAEEDSEDTFPVAARDEPAVVSEAERRAAEEPVGAVHDARTAYDAECEGARVDERSFGSAVSLDVAIEMPSAVDREALFRRLVQPSSKHLPLELLRRQSWQLAERLAKRHGLDDLVAPLTDDGLGFVVRCAPAAALLDQLDAALHDQVATLWWQLFAFAEMGTVSGYALNPEPGPVPLSRKAFPDGTAAASVTAPTLDPGLMACRFWRQLSDDDWCDWLALAHNYRELHRMARLLNKPLWSSSA